MDILLLPVLFLTLLDIFPTFLNPNCIPIEECGPLYWIHKRGGVNVSEPVRNLLKSAICENVEDEGNHPPRIRVVCPNEKVVTVGEAQKEMVIEEGRFTVFDSKKRFVDLTCKGTLKLSMFDKRGKVEVIVLGVDPDLNVFKKSTFGKESEIFLMENSGTCCWQIFPKENLKGQCKQLPLGFKGDPQHSSRGIKKVDCYHSSQRMNTFNTHSCNAKQP